MRELTTKTLLIAWIIGFLFTTMFMLSILVNYWFSIAALFLLICHVVMLLKVLRCPNCNKMQNVLDLTYAINHEYHCRFCGSQIIIQRRTNNEKV